jgi:hypothetical protein
LKRILLLIFLILADQVQARQGAVRGGLLLLAPDARSASMGGAGAALDGAASIFYNPAMLSRISSSRFAASYSTWLAGSNLQTLAFDLPVTAGKIGAGLGFLMLDSGSIPLSYETLNGDYDAVNTGSFQVREYAFRTAAALPVALPAGKILDVAAGLLMLREDLFLEDDQAWGVDLGLRYDDPLGYVRATLALQNFGPDPQLPALVRAGFQVKTLVFAERKLTFCLEATYPLLLDLTVGLGAEFMAARSLALRGGYLFNSDLENWSLGFGFCPELGRGSLEIDYAFIPNADFAPSHRISMTVVF